MTDRWTVPEEIHTQTVKKGRKERRGNRNKKEKEENEWPSGLERWLSR